jgi:hypothetical protein
MAYLRVEKPRFLFLEGSTGAEAMADVATVAPPDASAACAGTSAACADSSVDRPVAGASTPGPGACSSAAFTALGDGGAGSHLSGGACPPSLFSSSSRDNEYSDVTGGESPCCLCSWNSSSPCSRRSRRRIPRSFLRAARSCSRCCTACTLGLGVWAGQTAQLHGHPLLGRTKHQSRGGIWRKNEGKGEEPTHQRTVRKHNERPEVIVDVLDSLEVDGAPRPRGSVLRGETAVYQP